MKTRKGGEGVDERVQEVPLLLTSLQGVFFHLLLDSICDGDDDGVLGGGSFEVVPIVEWRGSKERYTMKG